MILIKKIFKSGVEITPLFAKNEIKNYLPAGKNGFQGFALNSEKGVKTPSWRILGTKKCLKIRSNKLLWILHLAYASATIFFYYNKGSEVVVSIQDELDKIFLSYEKILIRLNMQGIKTKNGKEITHKDLRKAIIVMQKKHYNCRWKSEKL